MGGFEPPGKGVLVFALLLLTLAATLICSTFIQRLRRSRSTRNLVALLTSRLRSSASSSAAPQHPEARPSKYMKRFAGVSVVNGNAIIDEVHYERLREIPHALVEVSEVGTNVDSADFSQSEVATTAASTYSRSGLRFEASRSHTHANREGSLSSEPSRFGDSGSYPGFPALAVDAEEMESTDGRRVVNVHSVPPTAHVQGAGVEDDAAQESPMSRQRTMTARVSSDNNPGKGLWAVPRRTASPDALGNRRVITNISVDDLAAHCAALEDEEAEEERGSGARTSSRSGSAESDAAGTAAPGEASHHHHHQHHHHDAGHDKTREGPTTPLTPYAYIMREKVKRARGTHSVVVVDPRTVRESSVVDNVDSAELPSSSHNSDSISGDDEAGQNGTTQMARRLRRTVRREHHRHHTSKGGFLVCQDFVPDLASRRVRRREANAAKPKFVFQMKDDEALYGRSQYFARKPSDDKEDD